MEIYEIRKLIFVHKYFGEQGPRTVKEFAPVKTHPRINWCFVFLSTDPVLNSIKCMIFFCFSQLEKLDVKKTL